MNSEEQKTTRRKYPPIQGILTPLELATLIDQMRGKKNHYGGILKK